MEDYSIYFMYIYFIFNLLFSLSIQTPEYDFSSGAIIYGIIVRLT